jgi:tetratricopeptide (TPR) repeat protein
MGGVLKYKIRLMRCLILIIVFFNFSFSWAQEDDWVLYTDPKELYKADKFDSATTYIKILMSDYDNFNYTFSNFYNLGIEFYEKREYNKALHLFTNILSNIVYHEMSERVKVTKWKRKYRRVWNKRYGEFQNQPISRYNKYLYDQELIFKKMGTIKHISNVYRDQGKYRAARKILKKINHKKNRNQHSYILAFNCESLVGIRAYKYFKIGKIDKSIKIIVRGINKINKFDLFGHYLIKDLARVLKTKYSNEGIIINEMDNANILIKSANTKTAKKYKIDIVRLKIKLFNFTIKLNGKKVPYNTYLLDFEGKLNYNKTQKLQIKGIDSETDFYIKMIYYLTGKNIDKNVF